ncbi:DNA polymerase/3'-5' exonuclease PolX [Patescibacteria group bacterium]|nr:DNA polymerase/3'-5' exonuclease PolX [Patescibacteria group bacterium]
MAKKFNNHEIANILREMSICYEMERIAFKPAAYERAADTIELQGEEIGERLKRGGTKELEKIEGVGPAIAKHIEELFKHGSFREYARCRRNMPDDVLTLTTIPDLGPHKVRILYEKLHVRTLNDLERAAREKRIRKLPGFGVKTEEKILRGIDWFRKSSQRRLLGDVLPLARSIERHLKSAPGIKQAVMAGSVRRRQETIGDFDLVVTSDQPAKAMASIERLKMVKKILERGRRNIVIQLENDLTCDVIVVPNESFGAALQHFTGNKEHNVLLRKLAGAKGLKLNEYGLWRGKKRLAAKTEKEIYRALGLPYIEPEIRLATGEIEAAIAGKLPNLLPYGALRGDLQIQTSWTDGLATIEQMAEAARIIGLEYIVVTDHTRSLAMVGGLDSKGLGAQAREIDQLNHRLKTAKIKFTVLKGAEVNIFKDGSLDLPDATLKKLDVVGAAIHSNFNLDKKTQTERLIRVMKNQHVDIIYHPTGRIIGRREPIELDLDKILRTAKETGTAMEINASPDRSDLQTTQVRLAVKLGVKLVINSDAHRPEHLRFLELGEAIARRGWAEKKNILNTKSVQALKTWLTKPKNQRR